MMPALRAWPTYEGDFFSDYDSVIVVVNSIHLKNTLGIYKLNIY